MALGINISQCRHRGGGGYRRQLAGDAACRGLGSVRRAGNGSYIGYLGGKRDWDMETSQEPV
jgi:hypothetical protein